MLNCNVVKDLLPNYIDGLTSVETKLEVLEHIASCADCNEIYTQMQAPISIDTSEERKNIEFLRVVKRKAYRNTAIIVGAILFTLVAFFVVANLKFSVSSDDLSYFTDFREEMPGGGELPEGVLGHWQLTYSLNNNRVLGFRDGGIEYEIDENGNTYSSSIIIIPTQTLPLLINPNTIPANIIEINVEEAKEVNVILRLSDMDIIFTRADMYGVHLIPFP